MTNKQIIDQHRKMLANSNAFRSERKLRLEGLAFVILMATVLAIAYVVKANQRELEYVKHSQTMIRRDLNETNRALLFVAEKNSVNSKPKRKGLPDVADWR